MKKTVLLLKSEDEVDTFLQNVRILLPDYTESKAKLPILPYIQFMAYPYYK
jgi:hypothetical protein